MKNRFCRKGLMAVYAVGLLSAVGLMNSCSDDYDLDVTMPGYLKGSIYDELKANGNFTTTVRLIDDLDYAEVLAKTGSKTLFVAPDTAYQTFFKANPWGVRSYDELSLAQKKYLLYNSMLDNAYVMEMMANIESSGQMGSTNYVSGTNMCLRQPTAATETDSVPFVLGHDLPLNYNELPVEGVEDNESDSRYGRFWDQYRQEGNRTGLYLVCDNTKPMITHFLENNMLLKNVTKGDVAFVLGIPEFKENRAYIYDARVIEQDVTCMNGYYNVLDKVLVVPGNMAEVIRTNGQTKLFSRILDRFSAPVYDRELTDNVQYKYANITDSVFVKRYFSNRSNTGQFTTNPITKEAMDDYPVLSFDPAWNAYRTSPTMSSTEDMAAMFVPNDEAMKDYFLNGAGRMLMDRYAKRPNTAENIEYNLDQIPLNIISALVNNLMKASFCETVPSKYFTIMNDARDQMFNTGDYPTLEDYKAVFGSKSDASVSKCLLANNGVVYLMNRVISPADYASVVGPALYGTNTRVVSTVVRADENFIQGSSYSKAPLQQYFSTYLKAMQSSFTFFVPVDEGLATYGYVDPASIATGNSARYRYWVWRPATINRTPAGDERFIAVEANAYKYDFTTGQNIASDESLTEMRSGATSNLLQNYGATKKRLLIEMINQHIIVHDNDDNDGVLNSPRRFFTSRDGAPVHIVSGNTGDGKNMVVEGGWQMQLRNTTVNVKNPETEEFEPVPAKAHECHVVDAYDQSKGTNGYGNGHTFLLDRPMQPSMQSVYSILSSNPEFSLFKELCDGYRIGILDTAGFREKAIQDALDSKTITDANKFKEADWQSAASLYRVFANGTIGSTNYYGADKLVRFFNNYRYTVYVPTNDKLQAAIDNGLPTWKSISDFIQSHLQDEIDEETKEPTGNRVLSDDDKAIAQAQVVMLVNFLKYHFQDESVYVDNLNSSAAYQTASIDDQTNVYIPLSVKQTPNAIELVDQSGKTRHVVTSSEKDYNLLARDARFNVNPSAQAASVRTVESSSFAVVHKVDDVLNFMNIQGAYNSAWSSPKKARNFVKRYQIKK